MVFDKFSLLLLVISTQRNFYILNTQIFRRQKSLCSANKGRLDVKQCCLTVQTVARRSGENYRQATSIQIRQCQAHHIYIWAGAHPQSLIEARQKEDPELRITTPTALLSKLATCLTHSTFFREKQEEFYSVRQKVNENTTAYYSQILDLYCQAEFPHNTNFLIVDKLIHGCVSKECKRKLMAKGKDVSVNPLQSKAPKSARDFSHPLHKVAFSSPLP